ncbi:uncharacterized protein LOC136030680 [Artemia franciscana]|uniref:uncharacterized protein LOC136030680 n=1 Tax=Artemia franciscana TaxID=6661 RepID=UPI0032D9AE74
MALTSTDWLMAQGWRQGLFYHCIDNSAERPLPFGLAGDPGCYRARDVGYIRATAALCIITLFTDAFATLLTGLGLKSEDPEKKYKYYRLAVYIMLLSWKVLLSCAKLEDWKQFRFSQEEGGLTLKNTIIGNNNREESGIPSWKYELDLDIKLSVISVLVGLIIYPVCFADELAAGNRLLWEFGWAYGVGWGASIFLFGAIVLLLCDKESEEIYYKERDIIQDNFIDEKA